MGRELCYEAVGFSQLRPPSGSGARLALMVGGWSFGSGKGAYGGNALLPSSAAAANRFTSAVLCRAWRKYRRLGRLAVSLREPLVGRLRHLGVGALFVPFPALVLSGNRRVLDALRLLRQEGPPWSKTARRLSVPQSVRNPAFRGVESTYHAPRLGLARLRIVKL